MPILDTLTPAATSSLFALTYMPIPTKSIVNICVKGKRNPRSKIGQDACLMFGEWGGGGCHYSLHDLAIVAVFAHNIFFALSVSFLLVCLLSVCFHGWQSTHNLAVVAVFAHTRQLFVSFIMFSTAP